MGSSDPGGGKSCAIALRAVERGFGAPPAAVVFHTSVPRDNNLNRVIVYVGRSVYRQRTEASPLGQASVDDVLAALREAEGT